MKMKFLLISIIFYFFSFQIFAQKVPQEWYLDLNVNRYMPTDKVQESGIGFGFGGKMIMPLKKKVILDKVKFSINQYNDRY